MNNKGKGVSLTSSLPFSWDSAVQALCNAFISCLHRNIPENQPQNHEHIQGSNMLPDWTYPMIKHVARFFILLKDEMLTLRRASFSTDSDRTICWISGSLCKPQQI